MPAEPQTDQELIAFDAEHICHGVTPIGTSIGFIIDKASGVSFFDTSGKEDLDGTSQLVCVSLGYKYKDEIADAAAAQMRKLPFLTTFWGSPANPSRSSQRLSRIFQTASSASGIRTAVLRQLRRPFSSPGSTGRSKAPASTRSSAFTIAITA